MKRVITLSDVMIPPDKALLTFHFDSPCHIPQKRSACKSFRRRRSMRSERYMIEQYWMPIVVPIESYATLCIRSPILRHLGQAQMRVGSCFNAGSFALCCQRARAARSTGVSSHRTGGTYCFIPQIDSRVQVTINDESTAFTNKRSLTQPQFRLDVATG